MRIVWLLGCLIRISTANAQPAPVPDAPPDTAPAPDTASAPRPEPSPPSDAPGAAVQAPAPSAPPPTLPPRVTAPGGSPPSAPPRALPPGAAGPGASQRADPDDELASESYAWQLALADVASVALMFSHDSKGASAGLLGYVLAAPVIHGAHDRGDRVVASLGLRLGLPIASALTWVAIAEANTHCAPDDDDCGDNSFAALFGLGLGVVTAMVLDDAVISSKARVRRTTAMTWTPQVVATPQRVGLGVLGRF